jgi:hypothetical protein
MLSSVSYSERTAKMVVVSWALVTYFDCIIKAGFVRDWIVNGEDETKPGQPLVPANINAEMTPHTIFDI